MSGEGQSVFNSKAYGHRSRRMGQSTLRFKVIHADDSVMKFRSRPPRSRDAPPRSSLHGTGVLEKVDAGRNESRSLSGDSIADSAMCLRKRNSDFEWFCFFKVATGFWSVDLSFTWKVGEERYWLWFYLFVSFYLSFSDKC